MTTAVLPWFTEVGLAHFLQVAEPYIGRLAAHLFQKFFDAGHDKINGATIDTTCQWRLEPFTLVEETTA
jgi:hypothetical protein